MAQPSKIPGIIYCQAMVLQGSWMNRPSDMVYIESQNRSPLQGLFLSLQDSPVLVQYIARFELRFSGHCDIVSNVVIQEEMPLSLLERFEDATLRIVRR